MKKVSFEEFKDIFYNHTSDSNMFSLWNEVCDTNDFESRIYNMEDLDEIVGNKTATELIGMLDDQFSLNDEYFYYDGYGRLHSVGSGYEFFTNGNGDEYEVFRYLFYDDDRMREFMEENDPNFDEDGWNEDED